METWGDFISASASDKALVDYALLVAAQLEAHIEPERSARMLLAEMAKRLRLTNKTAPIAHAEAIELAVAFSVGIAVGILAFAVFYTFIIGPVQ
jgi:hypothetical protein